MTITVPEHNSDKVVDIFTGQTWSPARVSPFIRLAPELDGLEMLYSNSAHPDTSFSIKILCWGLREDGDIVGLVPWLDNITSCPDMRDPLDGKWESYYDPGTEELFHDAPLHKALELEMAAKYYEYSFENASDVVQEIPDSIGTHAVFSNDGLKTLRLTEVVSWRLLHNGEIHAQVADQSKVQTTPVLPGDNCLYSTASDVDFRYFFQHHIANKIKAQDPEALAAIAILTET
ncbi:hypothetical protein A9Q89_11425 [Gammaproteobacteria bacterium 53_120_T64]|nr:hypothetical protein A9Q89_11425 [Gammaproteobacteria bacterium 53_120_T64]